MAQQAVSRGWNIKCFDKIKLTHITTSSRMHSNSFGYKSKSYNTAVTCHKTRDETDWFVVLRPQQLSMSYHFRYGDTVLLNNVEVKKYLHLSEDVESPVSKNFEVSLCDEDEKQRVCQEDQWIVQLAQNSQDDYWRVGEIIRLKNKASSAYLCSHRRKINQNDDFQVFGQKLRLQNSNKNSKSKQQLSPNKPQKHEQSLWVVSQITPFIYTASISQQKKVKLTQQAQQLSKLKASLYNIPKKEVKKSNQIEQILKMQNRRLEQIENERRKMEQNLKKQSCWQKYLCCCCYQNQDYHKIS